MEMRTLFEEGVKEFTFSDGVKRRVSIDDYDFANVFAMRLKFESPTPIGAGEYILGMVSETELDTVSVLSYWEEDGKAYFNVCDFGKTRDELEDDEDFFKACMTDPNVNTSIPENGFISVFDAKEVIRFFGGEGDIFPVDWRGAANYVPEYMCNYAEMDIEIAHFIFMNYGMKAPSEI